MLTGAKEKAEASAKASAAKAVPAVRKIERASMLIAFECLEGTGRFGSGLVPGYRRAGVGSGQQIGASNANFNRDFIGFAARSEGPMNARAWKQ
jgi:hypothetical protein